VEQPIYKSKKFLAYGLTILAMFAALAAGAPEAVLDNLSEAIAFGLPVLLGGQAFVDSRKNASTSTPPPA
jgi:hypothetical protein